MQHPSLGLSERRRERDRTEGLGRDARERSSDLSHSPKERKTQQQ